MPRSSPIPPFLDTLAQQKMVHVPFMYFPLHLSVKLFHPFLGTSQRIAHFFPSFQTDLKKTDLHIDAATYTLGAVVNFFIFFVLFGSLFFFLSHSVNHKPLPQALLVGTGLGLLVGLLFFIILMRYPTILAGKKAEAVNNHLVFALKDLTLQISAGTPLFDALITVGEADYGAVSPEFKQLTKRVNSGVPMLTALEELAIHTKSEPLKKTIWQIANAISSGASLKQTLNSLINELMSEQKSKIKDYAHELNLWSLVYMLFAVAVPTIGATMLVILSGFAGFAVTPMVFIFFVVLCFFIQIALIGFVKTRRPHIII